MPLTFGSLFAGIGGFDLALERAKMKCLWQVEIDDYANKILEKHWPHVKRIQDIKEAGKHNLEPVDLICGGFPCQPHSLAGKRRGSADPRDLWEEFARIIGELKPRWVLAENVPGLLSTESGRYFGRILKDLASFRYDAEWACIPASAVDAPHKRDRIWIVAYPMRSKQWGEPWESQIEKNALENTRCSYGKERSQEQKTFQGMPKKQKTRHHLKRSIEMVPNPSHLRCEGSFFQTVQWLSSLSREFKRGHSYWTKGWPVSSPKVCGVADGIPHRTHRLRCLGNAVVPQVVELLGKAVIQEEKKWI